MHVQITVSKANLCTHFWKHISIFIFVHFLVDVEIWFSVDHIVIIYFIWKIVLFKMTGKL